MRPWAKFARPIRLVLAAALALAAVPAAAQPEPLALQLDVSLNGQPLGLIGAFVQDPDGRIGATPGELAELGIKAPAGAGATVRLDDLPGLAYLYDPAAQTIAMTLGDGGRIPKNFDAGGGKGDLQASTGWGSVLNYAAFGSVSNASEKSDFADFDGASLDLDHLAYSPWGALSDSWIIGATAFSDADVLRLDTAWTASMPSVMATATIGDLVSGGLPWTRPVRLGGVQVRRNFGLRPDLITMPLPRISGSAAVPSTIDVYVRNVRTYSQDVPSGPYVISNVPVVTGAGEARIVVRDATGREQETVAPFYASADLLAVGLADFSAELGYARTGYGEESWDYGDDLLGAASARYGLSDRLTLEAHAEGGKDLWNGGLGASAAVGTLGLLALAASFGADQDRQGFQLYANAETELWGMTITAGTTRSFGDYVDLGFLTGIDAADTAADLLDLAPLKALDRLSLGFALPGDAGALGLSALHLEQADGDQSLIFSGSYTRPLFWQAALNVSAFADVTDKNSFGVFASVSMPIGSWGSVSTGLGADHGGLAVSADAARPRGAEPGSYGWRMRVEQGEVSREEARLQYRFGFADAEVSAGHAGDGLTGSGLIEGALVIADGGVFAGPRIDDAFAVVDAGAPGVEVFSENRPVGRTGKSGKLLVTGLHAYENNKIAIEPGDLPLDADYGATETEVAPADRSGARVNFGVTAHAASALIILKDADGAALPPGSEGILDGGREPFVVGYDGQAFIKNLKAHNTVTVALKDGQCQASFAYAPQDSAPGYIKDVTCQ